jgi:hypothetical protein
MTARMAGLRANSFAAIVMLLIQTALGEWVNLYATLPAADKGASVGKGYAQAISKGPVGLSIHAVLGTLLIITAAGALVRASRLRRPAMIGAAAAGLLAIVIAAVGGASFVGNGDNGASMSMAIATLVAIGAYALIVLMSASPARRDGQ